MAFFYIENIEAKIIDWDHNWFVEGQSSDPRAVIMEAALHRPVLERSHVNSVFSRRSIFLTSPQYSIAFGQSASHSPIVY